MSKFCSNCGNQLDDNARFCNNCGTQIATPTPEATPVEPQHTTSEVPPVEPQQPAPKKPNKKKILIAAIAVIVAIGAIIGILFATGVIGGKDKKSDSNTPEAVANAFMNALSDGNKDKAAQCFVSFIDEETIDEIVDEFMYFFTIFSNASFEIGEIEDFDDEDLEELNEELAEYGTTKVTEAKEVEVEITYTFFGASDTSSLYLILVKHKGEWKILTLD